MTQQTFSDGQVLTGAEMMGIPQGLLGACQSGSQTISTSSSPGTAVTGMSISVTLASNRNIALRVWLSGVFSSASGVATLAVFEGSTNLGQVNFGSGNTTVPEEGVLEVILATGLLGTSPSAGAHTYVVKMWVAGAGNFVLQSGGAAGVFTCYDV